MEKIIHIIEQLEKKLSQFILKIWEIILSPLVKFFQVLQPVIAGKISQFLQDILRGIINTSLSFLQILNSMIGPRAWNFYRHKFQNFIQKVQTEKAEKVKLLNQKKNINKTSTTQQADDSFFSHIGLLFDAFVNRLSTISPLKFATMGFLFLILLINSFHFLTSSTDLLSTIHEDTTANQRREIASLIDDIPVYYNDLARLSTIKGLKIPAYASKINKIKNLEIDTDILFYNRKGKQYFDEEEIVFLDHLGMTLEPIQPSFPLSPEGKMVIKEKIKYEINQVLKKNGVNSHVENVFLTNIFAN